MIENMISDKVKNIPSSGIRKFFDIVTEMGDAISLGVGEPDFDTPWHIREEGIYSLEKGKTVYTSNAGLKELREEVCLYMHRRFDLMYSPVTQALITVGGSEGIDLVFRSIIEAGDEVLVAEPSFVSYKPCIVLAGGTPVPIRTSADNGFKLTAEELEAHITPKTKALILSYPNNPTGAIMDREDLEAIAEVLRDKNILVISDEIYAELTYGQDHVSIANIDGMYDKTVIISGFSKAFAMTGWRLGYALGPESLISAMTKVHQYGIMSAPTTSQYAAIAAMKNGAPDVEIMKNEYDQRRRVMMEGFISMGLECFEPLGAFYVFPSIKRTGLTSDEFCEKLLYDQKVAVVPGTAFGESGEGYIRCSYAYSIEEIKEALGRIEEFVKKHIEE